MSKIQFHRSVRNAQLCITLSLMAVLVTNCTPVTSSSEAGGMGIAQLRLPNAVKLALTPALNPLEPKVAFVGKATETDSNIYVLNIVTARATTILSPGEYYPVSHPQWSPDGTTISFSGESARQQKSGIWILQVGTSPEYVSSGHEATWSPDGSRLAILDSMAGSHQIKIIDLHSKQDEPIFTTGTNSRQILSDVDWSPDGIALVFILANEENGYRVNRLYRINVDGNNLHRLVTDPQRRSVANPKWILGGRWIAFLLGNGFNNTLHFVSADGQCIVSPLQGLNDIASMDISEDGSEAVIQSGSVLLSLDLKEALGPRSLEETLTCQ